MLLSHYILTFNYDQLGISWHLTNNLVSGKYLSFRVVEKSRERASEDFPSVDEMISLGAKVSLLIIFKLLKKADGLLLFFKRKADLRVRIVFLETVLSDRPSGETGRGGIGSK